MGLRNYSGSGGGGGGPFLPEAGGTMSGNIVFASGTINDSSNAVSINANTRQLIASDGTSVVLDYSGTPNAGAPLSYNDSTGLLHFFANTTVDSGGNLNMGGASIDMGGAGNINMDGGNIVVQGSTSMKIGTATTQKIAFYNSTPIAQPANSVAIDTALVNLGLRASGGTANFAGVLSSGGNTVETQNNKNVANGYAGLDASGNLIGTILIRNDTAANLASVVLGLGQLGYATDTFKYVVGDGVTTFANIPGQQIASKTAGFITSTYGSGTTFPVASGAESFATGMGQAIGKFSIAIGGVPNVGGSTDEYPSAFGNGSFALGQFNAAISPSSFCMGFQNLTTGFSSAAFNAGNTKAQFGFAVNNATVGTGTTSTPQVSSVTSTTCTLTFSFVNLTTLIANGMSATLNDGVGTSVDGIVSSVTFSSPNTTMVFTANNHDLTNLQNFPNFYITAAGGFGSGYSAVTQPNAKMHACSANTAQYGDANLRAHTTDATLTEMTYDAAAPTGTIVGVVNNGTSATFISNRFILKSPVSYAVTLTVHGKQASSSNNYMAKRMFVATNLNGTMSISAVQTIGTDINASAWGGLTTPTVDSTNKSLQIQVTGAAATTINWNAIIEWSEISVA